MNASPTVTPKQVAAIEAILEGQSRGEAAKRAGVSERTLYRWQNDETFGAALTQARRRVLGALVTDLVAAGRSSVQTLREIQSGGDRTPAASARAQAARTLLQLIPAFNDHFNLAERLESLERALEGERRPRGDVQ